MKYLFHCDDINVEDVIDGTLYVIPPNKIVEVKNDFHADAILSHKYFQGLTEVTVVPKEDGSGFDWTPGYKQVAANKLAESDDARIQDWVQGQIEERVRKNYPALPPSDRLKTLIKRRGVVIENFGLRPVEIKQGQMPVAPVADSVSVTELIQDRNTLATKLQMERQERETDRVQMETLSRQVADLMKAVGKGTADDNKGDVDKGTNGQRTGGSEGGTSGLGTDREQPNSVGNSIGQSDAGSESGSGGVQLDGERTQPGSEAGVARPSDGGDTSGGGQGDGASAAPDPTLRPIRRPGQRR